MKRLLPSVIISTAFAIAPAIAQDALLQRQSPSELSGDWVLGTPVISLDGTSIGSINDIIIDKEEARVTAAVVSVGGFLGIGAKQIAVDWNKLEINWDANEIRLDITREEAEAAEEYAYRERQSPPAPEPAAGSGTVGGGATGGGVN